MSRYIEDLNSGRMSRDEEHVALWEVSNALYRPPKKLPWWERALMWPFTSRFGVWLILWCVGLGLIVLIVQLVICLERWVKA